MASLARIEFANRSLLGKEATRMRYSNPDPSAHRTMIAQAASKHGLQPRSISFEGAVRTLQALQPVMAMQGADDGAAGKMLYERLLDAIWNVSAAHFPGASELLDIGHGVEAIGEGAKAVYGQGSETAKEQAKAAAGDGKRRLREDGYGGVTEWVGELAGKVCGGDGAALAGVLNYFCGHRDRRNDALRLRRGQSIGSGLVEGSIKQLLNKRVKQTGARWKVEHVGPFVELGALAAGPEGQSFWEN